MGGVEIQSACVAVRHSLVEVCLLDGLLAPLEGAVVLVLQTLQVGHGLHALQLQTLVVVARFRVGPAPQTRTHAHTDRRFEMTQTN